MHLHQEQAVCGLTASSSQWLSCIYSFVLKKKGIGSCTYIVFTDDTLFLCSRTLELCSIHSVAYTGHDNIAPTGNSRSILCWRTCLPSSTRCMECCFYGPILRADIYSLWQGQRRSSGENSQFRTGSNMDSIPPFM